MKKSEHILFLEEYDSCDELSAYDSWLLKEARTVTQFAYAPYSNFNVGAVAKLTGGEVVHGTNQENASYPAGICAERVLLSAVVSQYPAIGIEAIAISYNNNKGNSNVPITPCGICRQSLAEFQHRFQKPIRIILGGMEGKVIVIEDAAQLLPLAFGADNLNSVK